MQSHDQFGINLLRATDVVFTGREMSYDRGHCCDGE